MAINNCSCLYNDHIHDDDDDDGDDDDDHDGEEEEEEEEGDDDDKTAGWNAMRSVTLLK